MAKLNVGDLVSKIAMFGIAGWVFENALCGDRYSSVFRGAKVPFLPVYAANGVALTAAAPYVASWPIFGKGLAYATIGTAVEYVGCQIDRKILEQRAAFSPGFGGADALARMSGGCVNYTRSAMWAGLGLVAEKFK
jgi:uncharacterized membrane protein